ncbi:Ppx/GppA phosphatase family protein [Clostridium hydrogeniformans]|uniref:Ppx/GppA phosphatase family protein n=1 Tax=Clostridium hydrogeniformans TaxID=349933 RepID=UPI0004875FE6|nr:Ppx/GppA phosphatase family protein [Clostridium hydrogeniformans]
MSKLGIIDIGSNSVRLVVSEVHKLGGFKILVDIKETLRLGLDVEINSMISNEKIDQCVNTLISFRLLCESMNVETIISFATEAIRKSSNKEEVLLRIKDEAKLDVTILTGDEEANLDGKAVINSLYVTNSLVIDIGGSSTKIAWIKNNELIKVDSLPFGALNLTHRYKLNDLIDYKEEDALKDFLIDSFKTIPWLFEEKFENIIGIGGSIRNLGKIDRYKKRYPIDTSHNYNFSDIDLISMYKLLKSKTLKGRYKVEGLSHDRADIIVASSAILSILVKLLDINEIIVSGGGIREGIIFNHIEENFGLIENILEYSLNSILYSHNMDVIHAKNVYNLSKKLFTELKPLHNINDSLLKVLKISSYLHDIGISVRYYDHQKHSFYIILNSQINGVNHKELLMAAYTAAFHKKDRINFCQYGSIINRLDIQNIEKMGLLLRISEALDKTLIGSISIKNCTITEEDVTIKVESSKDVSLEIKDALSCSYLFKELFGKNLIIQD